MIGSILRIVFMRILPVVVALVAIFLGWCHLDESVPWEGRFFAVLMPLLKGYLPPALFGHGVHLGSKMTPPVPSSMEPQPRPEDELFFDLPGSGDAMPMAGIGMCCRPSAYDDVAVERTIEWYLLKGGRHIDGAHLYLNHAAIGRGIANAIQKGVPRNEIFLTTKLWPSDFGYNRTLEKVPTFLEELGLDYINMVLMHFPLKMTKTIPSGCTGLTINECRKDTWKALSELRTRGIVRNVGVSNFGKHHLEELMELENVAPIANNQIAWNPWVPREWIETVDFCKRHQISVTGYNSLGGSLQHHQAKTVQQLQDLAAKYNRSISNIMLRWALQSGAAVIPGTGNPDYMEENMSVYDFELSDDDMDTIDSLRDSDSAEMFYGMKPGQLD
jgi:diketogulonate reductase-like aldo/keto reductase